MSWGSQPLRLTSRYNCLMSESCLLPGPFFAYSFLFHRSPPTPSSTALLSILRIEELADDLLTKKRATKELRPGFDGFLGTFLNLQGLHWVFVAVDCVSRPYLLDSLNSPWDSRTKAAARYVRYSITLPIHWSHPSRISFVQRAIVRHPLSGLLPRCRLREMVRFLFHWLSY